MAFEQVVSLNSLMPLCQRLIEVDKMSRPVLEAAEVMLPEERIPRDNPLRVPIAVLALSMAAHRRARRLPTDQELRHADAWQNLFSKLCQLASQADYQGGVSQHGLVQSMTAYDINGHVIKLMYDLCHQLMKSEGFHDALHAMAARMGSTGLRENRRAHRRLTHVAHG
jgi:hypothetical protein